MGSGSRAGPGGRFPEGHPVPPPNFGPVPLREVRGLLSGRAVSPAGSGQSAELSCPAAPAGGRAERCAAPSVAAAALGLGPRCPRRRRSGSAGEGGRCAGRPRPAVPPWRGAGSPWQRPARRCHWLRRCHKLREPRRGGGPGAPCVSGAGPGARSPAVRGAPCAPSPAAVPYPERPGVEREHPRLERGNSWCQTCRTEGKPGQIFRCERDGLF